MEYYNLDNQKCTFNSPEDSREGIGSAFFLQTFHRHLLEQKNVYSFDTVAKKRPGEQINKVYVLLYSFSLHNIKKRLSHIALRWWCFKLNISMWYQFQNILCNLPKSARVSKISLTSMPKAYASREWPVFRLILMCPSCVIRNTTKDNLVVLHNLIKYSD